MFLRPDRDKAGHFYLGWTSDSALAAKIKEQDSCCTCDFVGNAKNKCVSIQGFTKSETWNIFKDLYSWPAGQKVERITKKNSLKTRNGFNSDDVSDNLSFPSYHSHVTNGQTIQEIHKDDDNQENEGEEKQVSKRPKC